MVHEKTSSQCFTANIIPSSNETSSSKTANSSNADQTKLNSPSMQCKFEKKFIKFEKRIY